MRTFSALALLCLREAIMKALPVLLICCVLLLLAQPSSAQVCMPIKAGPEPDSGYSYIRTELVALKWVRTALQGSEKLQPIKRDDPQRVHKSVEFYDAVNNVSDDYDCAASLLTSYQDSKNEPIRKSVDSMLLAIKGIKDVNARLIEMLDSLSKAKKIEDMNQTENAKTLANLKSIQSYVRTLMMVGVKMSTFAIVRIEGTGDDEKPVAFLITAAQRGTLLEEIRNSVARAAKN
jgi:hypothetical protein